MTGRSSVGWQTALADLSLILFMITAAAVSRQPPAIIPPQESNGRRSGPEKAAPSPQSEPLAVYVDAPGAPPLTRWLQDQAVDPRQQLTITVRYGAGADSQSQALAAASRLVREAGRAGHSARIVVEPGEGPARVAIAFDAPNPYEAASAAQSKADPFPDKVAQSLLASR